MAPEVAPSRRLVDLDVWLSRLRSTIPGELFWLGLLSVAATLHVAALVAAFSRPGLIDFASFIENARAWYAGNPYPAWSRDPNAPHTILLFLPFVWMPLRAALALWLAISYCTVILSLWLVARSLRVRPTGQVWVVVVCLLAVAPPTLDVVADGNMIWPFALLCVGAWAADRRGRSLEAGLLLGGLATAKPFVGLWLVYFLLRRDKVASGGFLAGAVFAAAAGMAATGSHAWAVWFDMVGRISWFDFRLNASLMGVMARTPWDPFWPWVAGSSLVAIAFGACVLRRALSRDAEWLLVLASALLIAPLGWRYYYWFGVGPLCAVLLSSRLRWWQYAALAAWFLAIAPEADATQFGRLTVESLPFWGLLAGWGTLVLATAPKSSYN